MFPIFGYPKIELWISKNQIMDILNSAGFLDIQKRSFGYPKLHWFLDVQKWIMDTQKSNYRYPKFSIIFGYPKMYFRISKNVFYTDFWISKNRIMDIQNSAWLLDIQKCIFMYFWISKNELWISKNRFVNILKYIFGYPKFLDIHNYFVIYFGLVSVGVGWSSLGDGTEEYYRVEWNSMYMLGKRGVLKVWGGYDGMDLGYKREGKMV